MISVSFSPSTQVTRRRSTARGESKNWVSSRGVPPTRRVRCLSSGPGSGPVWPRHDDCRSDQELRPERKAEKDLPGTDSLESRPSPPQFYLTYPCLSKSTPPAPPPLVAVPWTLLNPSPKVSARRPRPPVVLGPDFPSSVGTRSQDFSSILVVNPRPRHRSSGAPPPPDLPSRPGSSGPPTTPLLGFTRPSPTCSRSVQTDL